MGEKASLNIRKRYWLIVLKGKSYSCIHTKSIFGYAPNGLINNTELFLFTVVFLPPFALFFSPFLFSCPPFSFNPFSCYILRFLYPFLHPCVSQVLGIFSVPVRPSLNLLLLAIRLLVYCSDITSTLMRPES